MAACGSTTTPVTPTDAGNGTDVPTVDAPVGDTPVVTDTGPGNDARTDAATGATCAGLPVVDLATAGMRTGDTTHYTGDSTAAWMSQTMGHPAGHQAVAPPSGRTDCPPASGELVFKYTPGMMASVLRITTTNAGTPHSFDTVLYVTGACRSTLATSTLCNDDDPRYASSADRRVSSYLNISVPASTTPTPLYIVLGGFYPPTTDGATTDHGAFELTVQEVQPVAAGGACTADGSTTICASGLTCVGATPLSVMGTCQANGTAAGSHCRTSTPACDSGLTCNTPTGGTATCVNSVATGMPCDGYNVCGMDATCVLNSFNGPAGVCHARGEIGTDCRPMGATGGQCNTGLVCNSTLDPTVTTPICVSPVTTAGAACEILRHPCGTGLTCITLDGDSFIGHCAADGTAARTHCRTTMPACDGALQCQAIGTTTAQQCINVAAAGGQCTPDAQCPMGTTCLLTDLSDRQRGTCTTDGTLGGLCTGTPACAASLTCSNPTTPAQGLCQNTQMMAGGTCNTLNQACAMGLTCVLNRDATGHPDPRNGTCRTNGTSAGSACRPGDMPCDASAMLSCAGTVLSAGVCHTALAAGGTCDPINGTTLCPMGQVCRPTAYNVGACAGPTVAEMEPSNNSPAALRAAMIPALTTATDITGTLPFGDVDCVPVQVAAMGGILASVDDGNGRCPASFNGDLLVDLYDTDGVTIRGLAQDTGAGRCGSIDGNRTVMSGGMTVPSFPYATGLAAGTYYVCARGLINAATAEFSTSDGYVLHVAPLAAH